MHAASSREMLPHSGQSAEIRCRLDYECEDDQRGAAHVHTVIFRYTISVLSSLLTTNYVFSRMWGMNCTVKYYEAPSQNPDASSFKFHRQNPWWAGGQPLSWPRGFVVKGETKSLQCFARRIPKDIFRKFQMPSVSRSMTIMKSEKKAIIAGQAGQTSLKEVGRGGQVTIY